MTPYLALAAVLLVAGCGGSSEPAPQDLVTEEQACAQAEEVTDGYQDALGDVASAEDAKAVIDGAIIGLRDIETEAAVATRIEELAGALSSLLEGVEARTPPAELQPRAEAVGRTSTALAQACGRQGK